MTKRYWVMLILVVVFILTLVLITQSGSGGDEITEDPAVPTDVPAAEATEDQERRVVPEVSESGDALTSSDITGAQHFAECAFRTSSNATIGVPAAVVQQGDLTLEPGDEIAVFTPDGEICTGAAVWTGSNIAITVWGDDPQSEPIDGLQEGDELLYRVWDASNAQESELTAVSYDMGDGKYTADGIYVVGSFSNQ